MEPYFVKQAFFVILRPGYCENVISFHFIYTIGNPYCLAYIETQASSFEEIDVYRAGFVSLHASISARSGHRFKIDFK